MTGFPLDLDAWEIAAVRKLVRREIVFNERCLKVFTHKEPEERAAIVVYQIQLRELAATLESAVETVVAEVLTS